MLQETENEETISFVFVIFIIGGILIGGRTEPPTLTQTKDKFSFSQSGERTVFIERCKKAICCSVVDSVPEKTKLCKDKW